MADTGFKYYIDSLAGPNGVGFSPTLPFGAQEISYEEFIRRAKTPQPGYSFGGFDNQYDYFKSQGGASAKAISGGLSGYTLDNGVLKNTSDIGKEAEMEAAVAAGTMKKVPIGNGFGYVPVGSPADRQLSGQPVQGASLPSQGLQFDSMQALTDIYASRPDLQQLYDANGQAKNPNDPRVAGIPTLMDWAQQYGANEYPNLAGNLTASAAGGSTGGASGTGGSTGTGTTAVPTPKTGNPQYDAILDQLNQYLDKLQKNGQQINPNIQITPEQIAQFTAQASAQIHPYFASQLQAATSSFLGNLGYDVKNYETQVKNAQTQYGRSLDSMASNLAEQGFAQSGIRLKQEGQLATDTQSSLDAARNSLLQSGQNRAAQFAQQYGGSNVPGAPSVSSSRVLPGSPGFDTTQSTGLYTLDPNIYNKLIGSEQNSEKQATDTLASTLASNDQTLKANTATRSLNTI